MKQKPTDGELDILQILWKKGPSTVRQVHQEISLSKAVVYTSTLKLLQIMFEKGLVTRDTNQKSHIYQANLDQKLIGQNMLQRLITDMFDGSSSKLVMQALGQEETDLDELKAIKKYVDSILEQEKKCR